MWSEQKDGVVVVAVAVAEGLQLPLASCKQAE